MRFGKMLAVLALGVATQAGAVTFTGVLNPVDGFAIFNFPWGDNPSFELDEGNTKVDFSISVGVIYEAYASTQLHFSYDIVPSYPGAVMFGEDYTWSEGCFYNSTVSDGCYYTDPPFPFDPSVSNHISGFSVGQKTVSYAVTRPESFDNCDNPVLDTECRNIWTARPDYAEIKIASHRPVSWSLSFKNVAGVVPEPDVWMMMIAGFGLLGTTLRRARRVEQATNSTSEMSQHFPDRHRRWPDNGRQPLVRLV